MCRWWNFVELNCNMWLVLLRVLWMLYREEVFKRKIFAAFLLVISSYKHFFAVCLVIVSSCPDGEFTCTSGDCLSNKLVCDFKVDCKDGSDEEFCGMLSFLIRHTPDGFKHSKKKILL